jgi:hypothetical protein
MADASRRVAGFHELSLGVNSGTAPTLLPVDQCVSAVNVSFRGDFPETRPPWTQRPLNGGLMPPNNSPQALPTTWTGIFQGSMHYDGEAGQSGWLVARGGRFFFITDDTFTVTDITAKLLIVTTKDFILPGAGNQVLVNLNGTPPLNAGNTVIFGAIHYTVIAVLTNQINLKQVDAGAGTVFSGSPLLDSTGAQIVVFEVYPPNLSFVFMFQAENYAIILGGTEPTLIWDGKTLRLSDFQRSEIPPGFLGAYGWGRIWIVRPDRRTFVAGDIVFGPSGTATNGFRDAILKFTENDFLNEGGSFAVPYNAGPITAMQFLATQDTSLGIGVLLVGTTNMVFSVNAPVDRTTWKNLTYPIQTVSLIDYGPRGPRNTVPVNGDMWYRSEDGVRSFIVARRNFPLPGNTPMSHEVDTILNEDTQQLLLFGSGMLFDNRLWMTVSPFMDLANQVMHRGIVVINFDLLSDLRQKQDPVWEGLYTGLSILQVGKARIADAERGFIWAQGDDVELWEAETAGVADETATSSSSVAHKGIECQLQTRSEDYGTPLDLKRLVMAEIYLEDIADFVVLTISYRPDQYPNWIPWQTVTLCSLVSQCQPTVNPPNCFFTVHARSYAARLTFPQPDDSCNAVTGAPLREFHDCQFQLIWQGHCRIRRFFSHVKLQTQPTEGICPTTVNCVAFPTCPDDFFTYDSHP